MTKELNRHLEVLQRLNLTLRGQLEVAEAAIGPINRQIQQLADLGWGRTVIIEGSVIMEQTYERGFGDDNSAQLIQAVLIFLGGIGVTYRDAESWGDQNADGPPPRLGGNFTPFED